MTEDFQLCDGVLTVSGVSYLKSQQFAGRDDIVKVVIGEGTGFFEEEVFAECENLEEAVLPETLVSIGVAVFTSCPKLSRVNIPKSVKSIEEGAFLDCGGLKEISLPDTLEEICDLAFQSSGLEHITVPASVKRIGEEAFFDCPSLKSADVLGPSTLIGPDAFGSCYSLVSGYIAPGFPPEDSGTVNLLYSLLWASCPERHGDAVSARARDFIRANSSLIMEKILKLNNVAAMNGIVKESVFPPEIIDKYVKMSADAGLTEITALLLKAKGGTRNIESEFEL